MEESGAYRAGDEVARKYRLTRVLGIGGMGCAWCARNDTLQMDVALKLVHASRTSPEAARRLLQEGRAAARIGHPSIVRVLDFGETDKKDPFFVMELLDGESLFALFDRKKKLSPERAVRTLLPVASALAAAHERGIVHRDLKPDNILFVPQHGGAIVPKVVDFGIAKLFDEESPRSLRSPRPGAGAAQPGSNGRVTREGDVFGSRAYMSPEQARGALEVDARTDVWALCVILHGAIVGEPPFQGPTDDAILNAILLDDPVPPNGRGVDDLGIWAILARAREGPERAPAHHEGPRPGPRRVGGLARRRYRHRGHLDRVPMARATQDHRDARRRGAEARGPRSRGGR